MTLSSEQIKEVKAQGFLINRGTEMFSARVITGNGVLSAEKMRAVCEAANKFGIGTMTFTTRQTVEVPGIPFDKIPEFKQYAADHELEMGGTGNKVRPIVSCKGSTCIYGLHDTQTLAADLHEKFFKGYAGVSFPHKIKISVGGCPNNCVKPDINDIGIMGQKIPVIHGELCKGCKKCKVESICPMNAAMKDKIVKISSSCVKCGRCSEVCPFGAVEGKDTLYKIYLGGQWGKHRYLGYEVSRLVQREEIEGIVESAMLFFKKEGMSGERFRQTIDRVGWDIAEKSIMSMELLSYRDDILNS